MSLFHADRVQCFCAFCKSQRKVYLKKRINVGNVLASALGAGVLTAVIFQEWDPRAIVIFVALLAISEALVQLRWRVSMVCKHCGFDPVLYLKDVPATVQKVQKKLAERKDDPAAILGPPLNLPKRVVPSQDKLNFQAEAMQKAVDKGRLVSRQV